MDEQAYVETEQVARDWCTSKGAGWSFVRILGRGGTAPVYEIESPEGLRALKIYDVAFSSGKVGETELRRVTEQVALGNHGCASLVRVYDGGTFEERLFLLMSRAPGEELEKVLDKVPRGQIRTIVDQIARSVVFLRTRGICHRDIKSANIFISDDFSRATLLDVSVIRNIKDPLGVGTDHGHDKPVLATARYSPPEYLFRLMEPGPEMWHALDIYQLGALLHDLIMRTPLFQNEYEICATNKYRFAWTVATVLPLVSADDVDQDLVYLARMALDKSWQYRTKLCIEDFLSDSVATQSQALQVLGLDRRSSGIQPSQDYSRTITRLREIGESLRHSVRGKLRERGVTAEHDFVNSTDDAAKYLLFKWNVQPPDNSAGLIKIEFLIVLKIDYSGPSVRIRGTATLTAKISESINNTESQDLPLEVDEPGVENRLTASTLSALGMLAVRVLQVKQAG